jgi:uncharacterized protein (TIGR00297 family)
MPLDLATRIAVGALLSAAIAWLALRRGSLSRSGALAAFAIGTVIYAGGGPGWFAVLGAFFFTSTLLGRVGRERKQATKREFSKGDTRDAWQALSNGGVAAACALGMVLLPSPAWAAAFLGALATANADTWATELGVLSRRDPISLVRLQRVPRGTSGAVSALGMLATLAGAFTVGAVFAIGERAPHALWVATVAGTLGSLADSLLGATLQARFHCPTCRHDTEGELHHCGTRTLLHGGLRGFGNDAVNAAATVAGAFLAVLLYPR